MKGEKKARGALKKEAHDLVKKKANPAEKGKNANYKNKIKEKRNNQKGEGGRAGQ